MPKKTILAVDDEAAIRSLIQINLEHAGYAVETAKNGTEALALIEARPYDLVISDIMMPEMDGIELLAMVRKQPAIQNTRFILLTANDREEDFVQGYLQGADLYLTKPFAPAQLLEWVSRVVA